MYSFTLCLPARTLSGCRVSSQRVPCYPIAVDYKQKVTCTPVHLADNNGHLNILKLLKSCQQVDINAKDKQERTPLHFACQNSHPRVIEYLLKEGGADPHIADNHNITLAKLLGDKEVKVLNNYELSSAQNNSDVHNGNTLSEALLSMFKAS